MIDPSILNSSFTTTQLQITRKPYSIASSIGCVKCAGIYEEAADAQTTETFYVFVPRNINIQSSSATLRVIPQTSFDWCTNESLIGKPQSLGIKINTVDKTTQLGGPWDSVETLTLNDINLPEIYKCLSPGLNTIEFYSGTCGAADNFHIGNVQLFITVYGIATGNI